ncbi:beta-N-acetylglucosaminidase [Capnocytophaga canimorsus]|uniref:Gh84 n=1 Tax=Capnocytophaga canimorsus (strain 5) TaxID=860228 RepID=F9YSQ8_CAPCC|nr:beta-N-acetylglucosaminidase [Capnocytophaga canimorsus]AEK23903.1 gh84 [Capnocytophaga canimorsus Cc5]
MQKIIHILLLLCFPLFAQKNTAITPTPQVLHFLENSILPTQFKIKENKLKNAPLSLISNTFKARPGKKHVMNVYITDKNSKSAKKFASKIPNKKEGYYLRIEKNNIYVIGSDSRGTYYGLRTLEQLLSKPELPLGEIIDYPDLPNRGVVEGFYGTPWSHEKRIRQIEFYGKHKLNTYIYGPKDDPYHSSPNWRLPYPEKEALQIKELVQKSNENYVDFVWAIHPGKDIRWNEEDRQNLLKKFEKMYALGVRAFAVFFDDISGEGTNPQKQAELLNFLHNEFVAQKKDVNPLIMCPTEYNKAWSNPEKSYLETLGETLHPSIEIMWTGNTVVADIDKPTMQWINAKIKRKAYIWWNFPVSDYVRNHMLLGPAYGNTSDIKNDMSGFVSNPMEHPEASKIAIYGVADYTWNLEKYNSDTAWKNAIAEMMPENKEALLTFAKHNSDLGANGHRYRREESVDFKPIAENFLKNLEALHNPENQSVTEEFEKMVWASEQLLKTSENKYLTEELHPWLLQFQLVGKTGVSVMKMYNSLKDKDYQQFKSAYTNVQNLQKQMFETDQNYNQNPYQPGVKTATLVVEPLLNQLLKYNITKFNAETGKNLKLSLNFNPNTLITNIKQLENQPLGQKGNVLRISPALEYISLKTNNFLGIEFEKIVTLKSVIIDFGEEARISKGKIQISADGNQWKSVHGTFRKSRWESTQTLENVKFVRFINDSKQTYDIQLKQFEVTEE